METRTISVYRFDELSEEAKDKVRYSLDHVDLDLVVEHMKNQIEDEGFFRDVEIRYDLSYTQGSGASILPDSLDFENFHRELTNKEKFVVKYSTIKFRTTDHHYVHEKTVICRIDFFCPNFVQNGDSGNLDETVEELEKEVNDMLIAIGKSIFSEIGAEYQWQQSDEAISDFCENNEIMFHKDGTAIFEGE